MNFYLFRTCYELRIKKKGNYNTSRGVYYMGLKVHRVLRPHVTRDVTMGYVLASERANSDHVMSARALPHTVAMLNATPPSYLSSLTAMHHFTSIRRIFHFSASLSPHPKPPDNANQTTQDSTADATSAHLAHPPVNHVTHVALDNLPPDLSTRTLILHWT